MNYFCLSCSYPDYTPILIRAIELWPHDPQVTTPILKLFAELVQNRSQRLQFDISSPNGILLFREASKVICAYGMAMKISESTVVIKFYSSAFSFSCMFYVQLAYSM